MNRSSQKSTKRRRLEHGCRLLRASLEHFICLTPGFKKNSYGEIQFKGTESRPTYAPFVTCQASATPDEIIRLLTEQWTLAYPKIIILVNGEFPKRDYSWLNVMNESWLITNGSSPSLQRAYNSSTIAIMDIDTVEGKGVLESTSNKGQFPAVYRAHKSKSNLKALDQTHTHFIFVEATPEVSVLEFRRRFLQHIGSIPMEIDTNATSFVTIPIVSVLVSDEMEALLAFSSDVSDGYPYVFASSALTVTEMVKEAKKMQSELTSNHMKKFGRKYSSILLNSEVKDLILNSLNMCVTDNMKIRVYPSASFPFLRLTLLEALKECGKYSVRSCVRLSMIWDCMDELRSLVYSRKQFDGEDNDYMTVYLFVALSLDRAEFLEYLHEIGVDTYSKLTVKMLWTLYYETLYNDQYVTETSFVIREFVNEYIAKDSSDLLSIIGRYIARVTKLEVSGLYSSRVYQHPTCRRSVHGTRNFSASIPVEDTSPHVPHADRDLFLWCILFGKENLAKVFWRNGSNFTASALVASSILRGQAEMVDFNTQDSALADELNEGSKWWSQEAISFVEASFRIRKQATLCLLTQKLPEYGGCSSLHLAYATDNTEFIAQPAPQSALDYIWLGKTKKVYVAAVYCCSVVFVVRIEICERMTLLLTLVALCCPLLVPCLNILDRTNHFLPTISQVYQSTYTNEENKDLSRDRETGLGAGVVYVMQTISKTADEMELQKMRLSRCVSYSEDLFDYFNSPSIKFLVHSLFLFISMVCLSLILLLRSPPYFSLAGTNLLTYLVLFYMIGITVDEIRQIATNHNDVGLRKISSWFSDGWNKIDFLMVTTYFIGKGFTFADSPEIYLIKVFFSFTLMFMAMRSFQVYLIFPVLGPKIYMMGKMFRDVQVFLIIMALVFLCYGVILESISAELVYETKSLNATGRPPTNVTTGAGFFLAFYNQILRKPYWQIYGDELGSATGHKSTFAHFFPALITAFYVLFANLLMVNLLIAMFSYTFQDIQDNATMYWKFYRFEVVKEFWDRPWLPSPFILIEDIVRFLQWFHNSTPRASRAFNRSVTNEQKELLNDFETEVQTTLIEKKQLNDQIQNALLQMCQSTCESRREMVQKVSAQLACTNADR